VCKPLMDIAEAIVSKGQQLLPPVATLLAAFFGAWFAYRLQSKAKEKERKAANMTAANRAIFTVFQMVNSLHQYRRDIINPYRDRPGMAVAMPATLPQTHERTEFDFDSLSFLLGTTHKKIVFDLFIEEQRFGEAIKAINYRSDLVVQQMQPALVRAGIQEGAEYSQKALAQALDPLLYKSLERTTEQVVFHVDRTRESLQATKTKMLKAFRELFPDGDFLDFETIDKPRNGS
jgi:hypothetical protein